MPTELRLCARCSHLFGEHKVNPVVLEDRSFDLVASFCFCCDCDEFVDEPDYRPSASGSVTG